MPRSMPIEGYDIVVDAGLHEIRDQVLYPRARVAALMGRVDDARRDANGGSLPGHHAREPWAEVQHRSVLGFVALSAGDPAEAVRVLAPAERLLSAQRYRRARRVPVHPRSRRSTRGARSARSSETGGGSTPRAGTGPRSRSRPRDVGEMPALIAAGLGDQPSALLELERAFAEHERVAIPFESARTRLINGQILRRMKRKREARESLEDARSSSRSSGHDYGKLGPRQRWRGSEAGSASPTELSETERRVADVVALGLTNKETADRLFMSVKTVESNLRRVYRKLGIRSRTELARRYGPPAPRRSNVGIPSFPLATPRP